MARVASTDLLCMFTISATSYPTTTTVGKVIIKIYKQVYTICYGTGHYSSDESTDTLSIIDTDEMKVVIENIAETMCDDWFLSGVDTPKPSFQLDKKQADAVAAVMLKKIFESTGMVRNIGLWNEEVDNIRRR